MSFYSSFLSATMLFVDSVNLIAVLHQHLLIAIRFGCRPTAMALATRPTWKSAPEVSAFWANVFDEGLPPSHRLRALALGCWCMWWCWCRWAACGLGDRHRGTWTSSRGDGGGGVLRRAVPAHAVTWLLPTIVPYHYATLTHHSLSYDHHKTSTADTRHPSKHETFTQSWFNVGNDETRKQANCRKQANARSPHRKQAY